MAGFPTPPEEGRSLELLARAKEGEDQAWNELFERYHDELLFSIRRRLGPGLRKVLQSEDIFQSVALEAFRDLPRFEPRGEGSLRAFLHKLVLNKIRDRADTYGAQKRRGAVPLSDSLAAGLAAPGYHEAERYEALEQALDRLPSEMAELLVRRKLEGESYAEIAADLGKSEAALRKVYSRGLARLSLLMQGQEP